METFVSLETIFLTGIHLSNKVHNAIICRYADSNGRIKFDDYVLVLARLTTVIDTLNRMERDNGGKTITEAEEFVRAAIYT
ncbi:unnamed protein product [Dicrocoelium dendriticum]|nr:unnamed protein product [Dicrocoelium dendriticum]